MLNATNLRRTARGTDDSQARTEQFDAGVLHSDHFCGWLVAWGLTWAAGCLSRVDRLTTQTVQLKLIHVSQNRIQVARKENCGENAELASCKTLAMSLLTKRAQLYTRGPLDHTEPFTMRSVLAFVVLRFTGAFVAPSESTSVRARSRCQLNAAATAVIPPAKDVPKLIEKQRATDRCIEGASTRFF